MIALPELQESVVPTTLNKERLRVGVLLDSCTVLRWQEHLLSEIAESSFAKLALIAVLHQSSCKDYGPSTGTLFEFWLGVDARLFQSRSARPECFREVVLNDTFANVIVLETPSSSADGTFNLPEAALETLKEARLDVLLYLGEGIAKGRVLNVARYGFWCFPNAKRSVFEQFQVLSANSDLLENRVEILSGPLASNAAERSYLKADHLSLFRNRSNLYWKRSEIFLRQLALAKTSHPADGSSEHGSQAAQPGAADIFSMFGRVAWRCFCRAIDKKLVREQWFLAFREKTNASRYTLLLPPRDRFYADPFVFEHEGKSYMFFEDCSFTTGKGVISFVTLEGSRCSKPEVVLEENCHLSYPFVFRSGSEIYMIPETKAKNAIQLYRAENFPGQWKFERVLLANIAAVDATLFQHQGKYWLFAAGIGTKDPWFNATDELFLFFSDSLCGPWQPHPRNPVVMDVRRCRSAGAVFLLDGKLIRPAQDSSKSYGFAVALNRIDLISESDYQETPIARIEPGWLAQNRGTHTYNRSSQYEVVDGRTLQGAMAFLRSEAQLHSIRADRELIEYF